MLLSDKTNNAEAIEAIKKNISIKPIEFKKKIEKENIFLIEIKD